MNGYPQREQGVGEMGAIVRAVGMVGENEREDRIRGECAFPDVYTKAKKRVVNGAKNVKLLIALVRERKICKGKTATGKAKTKGERVKRY